MSFLLIREASNKVLRNNVDNYYDSDDDNDSDFNSVAHKPIKTRNVMQFNLPASSRRSSKTSVASTVSASTTTPSNAVGASRPGMFKTTSQVLNQLFSTKSTSSMKQQLQQEQDEADEAVMYSTNPLFMSSPNPLFSGNS